jgi:hypothetical protein
MNPETRFSGHWIVAAQGTGKTNLLLHILASDLQKDASIIIMDSKGELTEPIRHLALGDRLIVIDPRQPIALNPLDMPHNDIEHAISHIEYILGALLEAKITPMQQSFFHSLLNAVMLAFPEPTLLTVQSLINDGPKRYAEYIDRLPEDLQRFFDQEWGDYERTRSELKWRLRLIMGRSITKNLFSAPCTRFDIGKAMDEAKVVVIDNAQSKLHPEGAAFLGRFFVARIWDAATARAARPKHKKKPVYVYIDEAHLVIKEDQKIAAIIDECRSQNIALILAHQRMKQIKDGDVVSALENCAIKMANVDAEAAYFSELLHIPVERINQLPRGHFAMHVRGEGSSIVKVPLAELPYRRMTPGEEVAHQERMIALYGYKERPSPALSSQPQTAPKPPQTQASLAKEPAETHNRPEGEGLRKTTITLPKYAPLPDHDPSKPTPWKRKT